MSIEAMVWVLNNSRARSVDRLVLLVLANYANDDGVAWPSLRTLEARAGVARHTVIDALARVVELGELVQIEAGGPRRSARYHFSHVGDNPEMSGANMHHSPANSGPDMHRSGAPTAPQRREAGAPDPSITLIEKDLARASDSPGVARGRELAAQAARARNASEDAAEPMTDDAIEAAFADIPDRADAIPMTEGGGRARGLRAELRDRLAEKGDDRRRAVRPYAGGR
jgi:hypothetical protein